MNWKWKKTKMPKMDLNIAKAKKKMAEKGEQGFRHHEKEDMQIGYV